MSEKRMTWWKAAAALGMGVACGFLLRSIGRRRSKTPVEPPTVAYVELARYLGRWYEIARYPNRFEPEQAREIFAEYTSRPDGRIAVRNCCRRDNGAWSEIRGWARVADRSSNAKLRVCFFWPILADYWIVDLGTNYDYAVVSEPRRQFLWILSRQPQMSDSRYAEITTRLANNGYDVARLHRVPGTERAAEPSA